jgi:hypothetical protein
MPGVRHPLLEHLLDFAHVPVRRADVWLHLREEGVEFFGRDGFVGELGVEGEAGG